MDSRPLPMDIAQHLMELELVEGAVRDQVARLLTDRWRGHGSEGRPFCVAGRPSGGGESACSIGPGPMTLMSGLPAGR